MFGTGFVRGLERTVDHLAKSAAHIGASIGRDLPPATKLPRPDWVSDQGQINRCTIEMGRKAIYDLTGERCSCDVAYWAARLYDRPGHPLENTGVTMAAFLNALSEHGCAPEGVGPSVAFNEDPPALARMLAQQGKRNLELFPIWGTGADVLAAVRTALVDGFPVGIALMADEAFKKPVNGRVGAEVDPEAGGHEVIIRGYRADGDFWMVNSWGTGWGLGGCAWIDPSRIAGSPSVVIAKGVS